MIRNIWQRLCRLVKRSGEDVPSRHERAQRDVEEEHPQISRPVAHPDRPTAAAESAAHPPVPTGPTAAAAHPEAPAGAPAGRVATQVVVSREMAAKKLATMVGLGEQQLAAQLSEADSNTTMATGLLALQGAAMLAIVTIGYTASQMGTQWGWPLIGFAGASLLAVAVLIRKTYSIGPKLSEFYVREQDADEFDFNRDLMRSLERDYAHNDRLLTLEQVLCIYPSLAVTFLAGIAELWLIRH
jgi:hypothetical protein